MGTDYEKDGVLHCGVCGQPKETVFRIGSEIHKAVCLCACEVEAQQAKEKAWDEEQRMIRVSNLRTNSIRDVERRKCRFETAEMTDNLKKCMNYVENWDEVKKQNYGLIMYGPCGNGKSFAAACIANALIDKGIPALMTSFPAILDDQDNVMDIARQMKQYDLVILDDLGAERQSQYALEKVFYVIDERYKVNKPLIITTNQELKVMQEAADHGEADYRRIYDRVLEMCVPMLFKDGTRRVPVRMDKKQGLRNLLSQGG